MAPSISNTAPGDNSSTVTTITPSAATTNTVQPAAPATNATNSHPTKTDKPRPHVCNVCTRSFARLEHLKRHERSHTKEKPFECSECTRAFARRDLLLRHQQKLHKQGETTSRARGGRRESTSGAANGVGRVRKNSIANSINGPGSAGSLGGMRPRANTISHIDGGALNFLTQSGDPIGRAMPMHSGHQGVHSRHPSLAGFPSQYGFNDMSNAMNQHVNHHGLPKLNTQLGMNLGQGLRTAPIPTFNDPFDFEKMMAGNSTINPAQLHTPSMMTPGMGHYQNYPFSANAIEDEEMFDWQASLGNNYMMNGPGPVEHMDGSSPSALSTGTQSGMSEMVMDGSNGLLQTTTQMWHNPMVSSAPMVNPAFNLESLGAAFAPELMNQLHTLSPTDMQESSGPTEFYLSSPPMMSAISPTAGMSHMNGNFYSSHLGFGSDGTSMGSSSMNDNSARQSSVTSTSSDTITDATRQALLAGLSKAFNAKQRKFSQPSISSPLSSTGTSKQTEMTVVLPSTSELQRFVRAYIVYFHPHLPFLHIPTLSFDPANFVAGMRAGTPSMSNESTVVGGDCLILAMAAIGALYEFEHTKGKELFASAKQMIMFYLDEQRRSSLAAASLREHNDHPPPSQQAPLWLVQAMLLNLVYGHNCGDQQAAEIATTHIAALVSLTKAADLDKQPTEAARSEVYGMSMSMDMDSSVAHNYCLDDHTRWMKWKVLEERKRTYYAVFILSSLLVTAYAHAPRVLNSEIRLDLPCDEDLWQADSAQKWMELGGSVTAQQRNQPFFHALSFLLEAHTKQRNSGYHQQYGNNMLSNGFSESELQPSTFGCYILINALHVYIWETRNRHADRHWKPTETDAMISLVEPALKAWQAAWRSNPRHSIERPNPFGPLSADAIPLLDCAYVRLYFDTGHTKESIWLRDFDTMAAELAKGMHGVDGSDDADELSNGNSQLGASPGLMEHSLGTDLGTMPGSDLNLGGEVVAPAVAANEESPKRERHLRKAAFYAADSLLMADRLGITFADYNSRELPLQSAMCLFECAQVLAEWVATVQERVGPYLGVILGQGHVDYAAVPANLLLMEEDLRLLKKVEQILEHANAKLRIDDHGSANPSDMSHVAGALDSLSQYGFGSQLLLIAAHMLGKAAVWPVTQVMARALNAHATHMQRRSEDSLPKQ